MDKKYFFILDTETTSVEGKICQLAYLISNQDNNEIVKHFDELCDPDERIEFGAMAIHHITNEMVVDKKKCIETDSYKVLQKYNLPEHVMVIHNAPFDLGMLEKEGFKSNMPVIDTLRCLKHLYPEMESHSLQYARYALDLYQNEEKELNGYFKEQNIIIKPHDALSDVLILKLLLDHLLTLRDYNELIKLTSEPVLLHSMKFGKHKGKTFQEIAKEDMGYLDWLIKPKDDGTEIDNDLIYTIETLKKQNVNDGGYLMPFGKFKGIAVEEIAQTNPEYLDWVMDKMENLDENLRSAITKALNRQSVKG